MDELYFRRKRLAELIADEIRYAITDARFDTLVKLKKMDAEKRSKILQYRGILAKNVKIVEVPDGFDIYVPQFYGEYYIENCIKNAGKKLLIEIGAQGRVKEDGIN